MPSVRVLDEDPDLARWLTPSEAAVARRHAVATLLTVERGTWSAEEEAAHARTHLGLLILGGFVVREVAIGESSCCELLGRGDLVRPWPHEEGEPSLPPTIEWTVLERLRIAALDDPFARAATAWPALTAALLQRSARRTHALGAHWAITGVRGLERRLLLLLWHLADRFGHVEHDGVVLELPLTHATLAKLVRARRPSVSTALKKLVDRGAISRRGRRAWILREPADLSAG